jgi:hypothetical protein
VSALGLGRLAVQREPGGPTGSPAAGGAPAPAPGTSPTTTPAATLFPDIKIPGQAGKPPDYAALIENDPAYQQLKTTLSAQGIASASQLRSAIQQALIQFGAVPDLPGDVAKNAGLDTAGTAALASGNPFSVLAQFAQKYQQDQQQTENQLAARGILSSGETGFQLGKLGQANALGQYNATNSLLGSIGTLNDQYVAGRQAAAQALAQGASTAEANQVGMNPQPTGATGAVTATYDPNTKTWVDSSGNHYDQGGNPVTVTPSTAPPPTPTPIPTPTAAPPTDTGATPSSGGYSGATPPSSLQLPTVAGGQIARPGAMQYA